MWKGEKAVYTTEASRYRLLLVLPPPPPTILHLIARLHTIQTHPLFHSMLKKVGKETSIRIVHSAKSRARAKAKANKPKPNPKTDTARIRPRSQLHDTAAEQSREHGPMNAQNSNKNRNENGKQNDKKNENIADKPDRDTGNGTAACGEFASYIPLSWGGGGGYVDFRHSPRTKLSADRIPRNHSSDLGYPSSELRTVI